jgi:hypothetical protein
VTQPIVPDLTQIPVGMSDWVRKVTAAIRQMQAQFANVSTPPAKTGGNKFFAPVTVVGPGGIPIWSVARADPAILADGTLVQFFDPTNNAVEGGVYVPNANPGLGMYMYAGVYDSNTNNYLNLSQPNGGFAQLFAAGSWLQIDGNGMYMYSAGRIQLNCNSNMQLYVPGIFAVVGGANVDFTQAVAVAVPPVNTTASAANAYIDPSTGALLRSVSSRKYKTRIRLAPSAGGVLSQLRAVLYKDKSEVRELGQDAPDHIGFIAEDFADVAGGELYVDYVTDEEGNKIAESIHYATLVVPLVQAYQEQQTEIAELRARIEALEAR